MSSSGSSISTDGGRAANAFSSRVKNRKYMRVDAAMASAARHPT